MSDFLRGDHNNENSPYFEGAEIEIILLDDLLEFAGYHMEDEVLEYFLNNCAEHIADEYQNTWLDDFPAVLCNTVIQDYVNNNVEKVEQRYLES